MMKRFRHPGYLLFVILVSLVPVSLTAQHPLAKRYREQSTWIGRAQPGMQMKSMMFAFHLQNQQELDRLLLEQQDPRSPNYHRWLTPEEFGSRFGVPQEEYQRAVQWLGQKGFSVKMQLGNRLRVYFDGVAQDVERAFGTRIQLYDYQGKTYFSNDLDPQIPAEFQGHGLGIFGLDDFPKEQPLFQVGIGRPVLAPADAHVAYNLLPLFQSGFDGTGQSIAIVARTDFDVSDVQLFRSMFGLPPNDPVKIFVGQNPGKLAAVEEQEVLLDTEWAGAIARGATIQVVISDTLDIQTSMDYILNRLFTTRVMTISFGLGESALSSGQVNFFSSFFSQAAAQGQTAFASSGDKGVQQPIGNGGTSAGPDISDFCAPPFVVCVGGTSMQLQFDSSGNATQLTGETAWSGSGGGKSQFITKPAYQTNTPGVPADGFRDVPDVAAIADSRNPGALIVRGGQIDQDSRGIFVFGGTSLSAPIWAGVFALVNQFGSPGGAGWANPRLYQMGAAQQQGGPHVFNDVTSGNNTAGTVTGFNAGPGYDQVTGWGSFNGDVFVRNFNAVPVPPLIPLNNASPTTGTIPPANSPTECTLNSTQYTINVPVGAVQLVVTLDGPSGGDVDLYVRKAQQVGDTGSFNPFISDYRSEGSTAHEVVYVGPNSPNPLTPGTYYIGVANCKSTPSTFTLSANVIAGSTLTKVEELSVDNGIVEAPFPQNTSSGTIVVNRLRPSRYPSKLTKVRIHMAEWGQNNPPTGQNVRLIAFSDPSGSGNPPSPTPQLLLDKPFTIPGFNGFMEFDILPADQPVIQSGDWYVGFQHPSSGTAVLASINTSGAPQQASFISLNGGTTYTGPYQLLNNQPPPVQLPANFMIRAVVESHVDLLSTVNLQIPPVGANTVSTNTANTVVQVGYATANATSGGVPFGTAVFSLTQGGNVVTEAGVPASGTTTHARIFIDFRTAVPAKDNAVDAGTIAIDTGFAVVNRGAAPANISYTLKDSTGATTLASGNSILAPGAHDARFIDQLNQVAPGFNLPGNFPTTTKFGTLDIVSTQPLAVVALRLTNNQRGDTLITTTPVADLDAPLSNNPVSFPQVVDGGGFKTILILVNTSTVAETGSVKFLTDTGIPMSVHLTDGSIGISSFPYLIPGGGFRVMETDGSPSTQNVGWALVTPSATNTPVGAGVFSLTQGGILVTESGIPAAVPTTHARIYVDKTVSAAGTHNTGLAIANPTQPQSLSVTINAFQLDGVTPVGSSVGPVLLNGFGHTAKFADQFINGLPSGFTGVLDISASSPFVALTLRSLNNTRLPSSDFLLTTFPIADLNQISLNPLIFPQIADSGGYQTQIILLSTSNSNSNVTVNYFDGNGQPLALKSGRGDK
jgi:pseudomonalisin